MAGIYLHIPYCKQACYYCDFHFSTNLDNSEALCEAMLREIELQRNYLTESIDTIYFGGGTPSILHENQIGALLSKITSTFAVNSSPEISLEANPDDLSPVKLASLRHAGINRLSIGIQSFDDKVLSFLNRAHTGETAVRCVKDARMAGFSNISIDLIYAIPGQPLSLWDDNISKALALQPEHISSYSLTIEEKTVFGRWTAAGKLNPVMDEVAGEQLEHLVSRLTKAGYDQYEVSNFGKPGYYSRHNSSYWKQIPYLGIGPSAHSYNGTTRQYTISNNHLYLKGIQKDIIPFEHEVLTREDHINEYLLTTLRTQWGADLLWLESKYHHSILTEQAEYVNDLVRNNLATLTGQHQLCLTTKGRLLADKIASDLFVVTEKDSTN